MSNHQQLNSAEHGDLRVYLEPGAAYGDNTMACITVPAEFRRVQAHFPIVFRRDIESGQLSALTLMGFDNGENLFLDGNVWDAGYRPLALAIQPFLIGRPMTEGGDAQVHIDMAHPRIASGGEGTRLFDEEGRPTPYLSDIATKLGDLDHAHREGAGFFAALERHNLVEPFSLDITLNDGSRNSLVGYQTIDEGRLAALDGDALAELMVQGHLAPIYMALASLEQFAGLVARKNARVARG